MTLGRKITVAIAVVAGLAVIVYLVALSTTSKRRAAAVARIEEPERLVLHRRLSDQSAVDDPDLAKARQQVTAFQPLLAEAELLRSDSKWEYLKWALDEEGRTLLHAEWSDLDALLLREKSLLDQTRTAAAQGGPTAAVNLTEIYLPHYGFLHELVRLLHADAMLAHRQKDPGRAAADIVAILQLGQALAQEPLLIAQLAMSSFTKRGMDLLEQDFPPGTFEASHEQRMLGELQKTVDRTALSDCAIGEAAINLHLFAHPKLNDMYDAESAGAFKKLLMHVYVSPLGRPLLNLDVATYVDLTLKLREALLLPYAQAVAPFEGLTEEDGNLPRTHVFSRGTVEDFATVMIAYTTHEARVALTCTGLAVERHRANTGSYPVALSAISSRIPGGTTTDPFSGAPLIYQQSGDSFLLYSLGPNETDDAGYHDPADGDIVWRGGER